METFILFRAGLRRHRGSLSGVFLLLFLVSLALGTVLTVWSNSGRYVSSELDRAGFGALTAWVSQVPDLDGLEGEIAILPEVSGVETQMLIFSNYEIDGQESDSEGQLITLEPGEGRYRFFTSDLSGHRGDTPDIAPGQVYVSPSLVSMFGAALGDEIVFPIARAGGNVTFTVGDFYEDPMMGSSMIGMKGFLICREDHDAIVERIRASGIDALAQEGAMLHIFSAGGMTLTTTGIRAPIQFPALWCAAAFGAILLLLGGFILWKTGKIGRVSPMKAIRGEMEGPTFQAGRLPALRGSGLTLHLALRQVLSAKGRYAGACAVAALLVFFACTVGRVDGWLGRDGKGMMDAFNPADHDLGVQTFGTLDEADAEALVRTFTGITDSYLLAMPGVAVNGVDYTANVIDQPERFHILRGRTCRTDSEIVVTEFIAAHFGLELGDTVTVSGALGSGAYTVTGVYSCANDMGDNIGMTAEGYLKIGRDDPQIWCHHYFLSDPGRKAAITQALEAAYGGDVHVHENSWPGLLGIIAAMRALLAFTYAMTAAFILIVTAMTGSRLLAAEQRDTGIYKALGFSTRQLRVSFALRFGLTAALGGVIGAALAALLTDPLVSSAMKLAGISNFTSAASLGNTLLPVAVVAGLFTAFAYLWAGKIKKTDLTALIAE